MCNNIIERTEERVKDTLERDVTPKAGDFVTIDNDSSVVEVYILATIQESSAMLYELSITDEHDDIRLKEVIVDFDDLIYLDESFVNVGGYLWNIRERVVSGNTEGLPICISNVTA